MFDNLDDENHDNVNYQEKEQLKKYEKKGKKTTRKNVNNQKKQHIKIEGSKIKKRNRDNFDHLKKYDRKTKINNRLQHLDKRNSIFNNVQMCSMVDPSILTIPVFRLNEEDFETANQESPTYICDICWKFKF